MGRAPCCDKANVKRGPWSPEEDATLKSYLEKNGTGGNWIALPQKAGLRRCGKSCRLRWLNYLRPDIKHGGFTEEEDNIICSLYKSIGSRWSVIASHLPGRTDNDIKNHWNTKLKKRLFHSQQHQPNCNTVSTTKASSQTSTSPPIPSPSLPAMKSENCNYFSGYSVPLICTEPLYQLPDFSGNTSGYILSPPTDDISAASSSSMTMENMGMGMMGSSTSSEFFDWGGLHGWIGEGEQDLIFGGNLWGGGYEGSGKAHDLYRSLGYS